MANQISLRRMAAGLLLVITAFFLSATTATSFSDSEKHDEQETRSTDDFWSRALIVSPSTAKAVMEDRQLQDNFLDAVELTAGLAKRLAEAFETVPELQQASDHIETYRKRLQAADGVRPTRRQMSGMAGATGGLTSLLTSSVKAALSNAGNSLLQDVDGAAMFLGTGLGAGTAQGLNLATAQMTTQVAAKVAADNNMKATGINPAIQNAALGATASLLGAVNVSSLSSSVSGSFGNIDIRGAVVSLATGLGNGTSAGLQLSPQAMSLQPPVGNSTGDLVGSFAFGLTKTVASNIDVTKLVNMSGGSFDIQRLTGQPTSQIALSLAQGIGNGTASGLKLTQANIAPPAGNSAADTLGAFGFGLVDSIARNINTSSLTSGFSSMNLTQSLGNINLAQTASSFGTGLGSGAASGLGLSSAIVGAPDPNASDIPSIAGNFAFGLTKSVTQNFNISSIQSGNSQLSGLSTNLDVGRVAQGAAVGFIQGADDAVTSMGGLQALINGTAKMATTPLPATSSTFNDSVGGAATGFGQGLGGQGTLAAVQLLSQINITSMLDGFVNGNNGNSGSASAAAAPASQSNDTAATKRSLFLPRDVVRRQTEVGAISTDNSFNLSVVINADSISSVSQRVIDALTCEGIGGFILMGLGLVQSGTISLNGGSTYNTTLIKQALPRGVMHFTSDGNIYQLDGTIIGDNIDKDTLAAASGIIINGNPVITFAAFLVVHILLALLVFTTLLPLVISIDAARNILVRLGMHHVLPNIPRWMDIIWIFLMTPLALLALVFGSLAGGTSAHFRSAHGILGLFAILFTVGATVMHLFTKMRRPEELSEGAVFSRPFSIFTSLTFRTIINQTLLVLVLPVIISGFADLSTITICITRVVPFEAALALGTGLLFLYTISNAASGLAILLSIRDVRSPQKGGGGGRREVERWSTESDRKAQLSRWEDMDEKELA